MTDKMQETTPTRVFKIGNVRIVEDETMQGKDAKTVQKLLSPLYPQVDNATIRERTEDDTTIVEYIARAGRKG